MSKKFNLYSSEGCHLCELAYALCHELEQNGELNVVDIVENETLVAEYGVHIPVLERTSDNKKLFWPFNQQDVNELI